MAIRRRYAIHSSIQMRSRSEFERAVDGGPSEMAFFEAYLVAGGVGEIGEVKAIELQSPVGSLVGKQVVKVGRSSGLTTGTVLAYALEYNDERGVCFLTDFLVVGENHRSPFDLEGDSGSLIVMKGEEENARPIGIIWGGTGSRGRLKLKVGESPESWTTGVDLGRLLTHLQLDLITTDEGLKGNLACGYYPNMPNQTEKFGFRLEAAVQEQRAASTTGMSSMVADSSPPYVNLKKEKRSPEEKVEASLGPLQVQHIDLEERIETKGGPPSVEHQFMPSFSGQCSVSAWPETAREDLVAGLANGGCDGDLCVGLRLGEGDNGDGAFIPFADDYDLSRVTTSVKGGVGEIGEVKAIELQSPVGSLVGKQVVKVGRSSGLTTGTVLAYALEYNDERGVCFLTDFLVVGENHRSPFDLEGDSGSLIVMKGEEENARPIGIIWGGTGSRGRLKLKVGESPESWTTGVDLGRLLTHLQLDLITTDEGFKAAVQEQRAASTTGMSSMVADSSPPYVNLKKEKRSPEEKVEASLGPLQVQHIDLEERIETKGGPPSVEHQFMPSFSGQCSVSAWPEIAREDLVAGLANGGCDGDLCVGLRLGEGDNGGKRRRTEMTKDRMRPAE
ncbi:hypothetical protein F2Q70_00037424 [Brassica cretica]|uniref:Nal1 C-terminal domain-containing protein n=1 Tax=Brassica cretica TaxID=69181 RepID=A0A8S9K001_BRACR|nr:hypothetical protein F2Q70_00037424 [Brassica cretica]